MPFMLKLDFWLTTGATGLRASDNSNRIRMPIFIYPPPSRVQLLNNSVNLIVLSAVKSVSFTEMWQKFSGIGAIRPGF